MSENLCGCCGPAKARRYRCSWCKRWCSAKPTERRGAARGPKHHTVPTLIRPCWCGVPHGAKETA